MAYEVLLVVNELVTNAIVHAAGTVTLALDLQDQTVRIVVADDSAILPTERAPDLGSTGGRGLILVASMSLEWGVIEQGGGKTVWADLPRPARESRSGLHPTSSSSRRPRG